jgi:hypothetical protein
MERFIERHRDRVIGVLSGFDRVLFRGTLRSISHLNGMRTFLHSHRILYKDFGPFAERLSGRIKRQAEAMAADAGRPYRYLYSSGARKEDIARQIAEADGIKEGLICILSAVEPCMSYQVRRDRELKQLVVVPHERKCLHLYFYYLDREFGFMHVRLQTWVPFTIQVCINGREWLANRMQRAGIRFERRDNCFSWIEDLPAAQRLMDRLETRSWARVLNAMARRVNPWIDPRAGLDLHGYYWSIREGEYATDVMFRDDQVLGEVYPRLVDHAIQQFTCQDVLRFLGRRTNCRFPGEVQSNLRRRPEGIRVKHVVEENSIKMYDKQGSVLRIETTINNPRRFKVRRRATRNGKSTLAWLPMRKGIADIPRRVELSRAANERYLEALAVVGEASPTHRLLDPVSQRVIKKDRPYRALRPISPEDAKLFRIVLRGEFLVRGFTNAELRRHLLPESESDLAQRKRASGRITRWIRLLRAHGLVRKVSTTRYYRVTEKGQMLMTTALRLRETNADKLIA